MSSSDEVHLIMPSDEELEIVTGMKKVDNKNEAFTNKVAAISVSKQEEKFRKENFAEINIENVKLLCTSCGKQLFLTKQSIESHPTLEVLLCKGCADFYGEGDFSVDEDGTDKYCRWCGQGGTLYLCSDCSFGFCRPCIKRNLQRSVLKDVLSDDWLCFSCNSKPLWELRGICAATLQFIKKRKEAKRRSGKLGSRKLKLSGSETDEEKVRRKEGGKKRQRSESPSTSKSAKKKRVDEDDKETTSSERASVERKKPSEEYSKKKDREIVLSEGLSEKLIGEYEELARDFFKVLNAVSSEGKNVLKRKLSADEVKNFTERYDVVKKVIDLRDLSIKSLSLVCENFVMAYQKIITCSVDENTEGKKSKVGDKKKKGDSGKESLKPEKCGEVVVENTLEDADLVENKDNKEAEGEKYSGKSKEGKGKEGDESEDNVCEDTEKMSCDEDNSKDADPVVNSENKEEKVETDCENGKNKLGDDEDKSEDNVSKGTDKMNCDNATEDSGIKKTSETSCIKKQSESFTSERKAKQSNKKDNSYDSGSDSEIVPSSNASQNSPTSSPSSGNGNTSEVDAVCKKKMNVCDKKKEVNNETESPASPRKVIDETASEDSEGIVKSDTENVVEQEPASNGNSEEREKINNSCSPDKVSSKSLSLDDQEPDNGGDLSASALSCRGGKENSAKSGSRVSKEKVMLNSVRKDGDCGDKNLRNKTKEKPCDENDSTGVENQHKGKIKSSGKETVQNHKTDKEESPNEIKALQALLMSSSEEDNDKDNDKSENEHKSLMSESNDSTGSLSEKYDSKKKMKKAQLQDSEGSKCAADSDSSDKTVILDDTVPTKDFHEDPRVKDCCVVVQKLQNDSNEKHTTSDDDVEGERRQASVKNQIDRLTNLKSLDKVKSKKESKLSETDDEEKGKEVTPGKTRKKKPQKKEKETLQDFHNLDSDGSSNNSDVDDSEGKSSFNLRSIFENLNRKSDKVAKEMLLKTSSSDSSETDIDKKDEEKQSKEGKEKKPKVLKENETKEQEKEEKKERKEDSVDSDDSDLIIRKKAAWRNEKLLRMKLSESDTSDDNRRWNAKAEREKEKGEDRKKKFKNRIVNSDSDVAILSSTSSDSDSEEIFKRSSKRKQKRSSETDKSKSMKSASDSDKSQKKKKTKRRRIRNPSTDTSDSDGKKNECDNSQKSNTPGKGRKNIRRVLKDHNVGAETKRAAEEEEERRKRIAEKQKLYNEIFNMSIEESVVVDKLVLDFDPETKEELLKVDETLVKKLKPHQVKGIKFMWDACFESLEQLEKTEGSGCILAHCMGLGKTLQVITLIHTVLTNQQTKIKTVMVVCPLSTVLNWVNEFSKWVDELEDNDIEVYELTKYKQMYERVGVLSHWHKNGGVMIIGYNLYRSLCNAKGKKKRNVEAIRKALIDPGPDLVVCDEGHLLKNEGSALSKAMNLLRTRRRIVLTGTPLQNNLVEYHCMVQFVKPSLLGTRKEFLNRFVNPINNGQYENSTAHDVKVMKRRAHVLHKMLDSSVQRYDYSVLTPFLPPKFEYALSIRLTELQVKLYRYYLDNIATPIGKDGAKTKTATLFKDYQALSKIWTHPRVLLMNSKKVELKRLMESDSEGSLRDFIASDSDKSDTPSSSSESSNSDIQEICSETEKNKPSSKKPVKKPRTRNRVKEGDVSESESEEENKNEYKNPEDWWRQFISDDSILDDVRESGKLSLLFTLLAECDKIGDKLLVFSQSLFSLDLIEYFLARVDEANQNDETKESLLGYKASWSLGLDYFRLDGSSSPENRSAWCKAFNREDNVRSRLFLISTRAGGLGINLCAANRVVIFDASWNPSYDLQSIFRVYRFGQKKPCYIYRFLAQATMEEKIYNRQVTKLSLACRVVDEQQIERHYSMSALQELYIFNPEETSVTGTPLVPKDILLAELVRQEDSWIKSYHEHDTLLENKEEEELNEDERKAAWEDYEKEKQGLRIVVNQWDDSAFLSYLSGYGLSEHSIRDNIIKQNPAFTDAEIQAQFSLVVRQLYDYVSSEAYNHKVHVQQNYQRLQYQQQQQQQVQQQQQQQVQQQQQQQPVYFQNPQMQPHVLAHPQDTRYTQQQRVILPKQSLVKTPVQPAPTSINSSSTLDHLMMLQKENSKLLMDHIPSTSSNSVNTHQKPTIKVKSFGQINNSFGTTGKFTNPFAGSKPAPVGLSATGVNQRVPTPLSSSTPKKSTDVIDLE